ncbi:MAG: hypothetical protein U0Q21_15445 [Dermatophilaceae bacterium]
MPIYNDPHLAPFDLVPKMRDVIDLTIGQSVQLLSGFRGCGKTSELLRLREELEADGYAVAYLDINSFFNTRLPLDAALLPVALAAGFAQAVEDNLKVPVHEALWSFLQRLHLNVGFEAPGVGGLALSVSASVRDDVSFAASARDAFRTNRKSLRAEFHAFFLKVLSRLDPTKPMVFIVDSIDHWRGAGDQFEPVRESVELAFTELADDLALPNIHVIYTIPNYLAVPAFGTRQDVVNVKLSTRQGDRFEPGFVALRRVLERRAPQGDLARFLDEEGVDRLIAASGGLFRDLLRLVRGTLLNARGLPATEQDLARAEMQVREDYTMTFAKEHLTLLSEVDRTKELFVKREQSADEAELVSLGAILRYPNDQATWFAVHPLLRGLTQSTTE